MVAAVLDIGSNSVLMLAVRVRGGRSTIVAQALATTRLGAGLAVGRPLEPAACRRTSEAVAALLAQARAAGAARCWAFATGAARRASDGAAFCTALARDTGVPVEVLSGEREARLAFEAAAASFAAPGVPIAVVDVGGATTEITLGHGAEPSAGVSLPLGALTLTEAHAADLAGLRAHVAAGLDAVPLLGRMRAAGARLVVSGGTATALAQRDLGLRTYDAARVHGHVLAVDAIPRLLAAVRADPVGSGLDPERAAILPAGALVLEAIARRAGAATLVVSDRGVRHAYLRAQLAAGGVTLPAGEPCP